MDYGLFLRCFSNFRRIICGQFIAAAFPLLRCQRGCIWVGRPFRGIDTVETFLQLLLCLGVAIKRRALQKYAQKVVHIGLRKFARRHRGNRENDALFGDDLRIRVDRELSFLRRPVSGERIRERVCRLFLGTLLDEHGLIEVCGLCRRLAAAAGQHSSKQCSGCPAQGFSFHFNTSFLLDVSSIAERNGKEFTAVLPFSYVFASGSTMCAVVPLPGVLSSASVPPWTTAISRTSASPRPKPPFFLLREGSPV